MKREWFFVPFVLLCLAPVALLSQGSPNGPDTHTHLEGSLPGEVVLDRQARHEPILGRSKLAQPANLVKTKQGNDLYSSKGTEFWLMFLRNYRGTESNLFLDITSAHNASGTVSIEALNFNKSFTVSANGVTRLELPTNAQVVQADSVASLGIHVETDQEVSVYGMNQQEFTTDGFLGLPVHVLGNQYLVMTYPALTWSDATTSESLLPQFGMVSPHDGNVVTITPRDTTLTGRLPGVSHEVVLNRGETYMVQGRLSNDYDADLTGSFISSSKPIAVFSGNACASVPQFYAACDHLVEQLPPLYAWGKTFLARPLEHRENGDTWRFLSSGHNTRLYINGEHEVTLGFADFYETVITDLSYIESTNPVLAVQFSNSQGWDDVPSDPFMMIIPPYQQFLSGYDFATPGHGFENNFVTAVAPSNETGSILLNGTVVDPSLFEPIHAGEYSAAGIPVEINTAYSILGDEEASLGIYVYGFSSYDSYGFAGGAAMRQVHTYSDLAFLPNAFMPSSQISANQNFKPTFFISPLQYSLAVFNRWGGKIFKTTDESIGWDGNSNGSPAPPGGYVYELIYTDIGGTRHELRGIVMLVR